MGWIIGYYEIISGQLQNKHKYGVIFGKNVPPDLKRDVCNDLGIKEWDSLSKYLGLPAIWGRAKSQALSWIKDIFMDKVAIWKNQLLSLAGKEVLIKFVTQSIPTYAVSIVLFPRKFCAKLC